MRLRMAMVAALLALAACGDEDRTQTEYTPSNDKTSTSAGDTAAPVARAVPVRDTAEVPAPPQDSFPLAFAPLGRATARGTGQVAAAGKATAISVSLVQTAPGSTYEGSVRRGVCAGMGATIASLVPVSADSTGRGQAASDVNVPVDSLTGSPHVVAYGRGGRPETCAQIPSSAPLPTPVPAQPKGGPQPLPPDSARG
jgi:hypothetical protein